MLAWFKISRSFANQKCLEFYSIDMNIGIKYITNTLTNIESFLLCSARPLPEWAFDADLINVFADEDITFQTRRRFKSILTAAHSRRNMRN